MAEKHKPIVGDFLVGDNWRRCGEALLPDETGFSDSSFPGCQFRIPDPANIYKIAVNIKITGLPHWDHNRYKSRCKIEFVGDGEPSTFAGGWLWHD
ncbi:MAG: hypothetical protein ACYSUX_00325 [Planctomycetota bacterium]|jgi:hypothetical protein